MTYTPSKEPEDRRDDVHVATGMRPRGKRADSMTYTPSKEPEEGRDDVHVANDSVTERCRTIRNDSIIQQDDDVHIATGMRLRGESGRGEGYSNPS